MRRTASGNGTLATPMSVVDTDPSHFEIVKSEAVALVDDSKEISEIAVEAA